MSKYLKDNFRVQLPLIVCKRIKKKALMLSQIFEI